MGDARGSSRGSGCCTCAAARDVLAPEWLALQREPTPARPAYGLMWWLRDGAFYAHGTGEQLVWCDPARDLVAVVRWARDPFAVVDAL